MEKSYGEITGSDFRSEENCLISKGLSADTLRIVTNRFLAGKSIIYLESIGMPCVIRGNLFNSLSSNSLINATASPVVFSFNRVFFNQQNTSISINQTSDCKIDHNVFTSNGTGSAFSLSNVVTAVCENNTFYNFQTIITNYSSMLSFINNIAFLEPGSTASAIVNVGSFPNVIRYNDFYGYLSYYSGITNHDLSVGNFSDDPLFVSRDPEDTLNYLCLECNSPGIDQGDPDYSAGEEPNSSLRIDLGYTGGYSRACGRLSVGIDGHNQSEAITRPDPLVIFPQPSEGRVRAMLVGEIRPGGGWVRIYHVSGQEIATVWVNDIREFEINGSAWNSGVYLISIESGDRRYTGKMVIIH